ncbi:MAG TPA: iron-sulfur cluster assembly scaffold protein [Elusimicrobiota bacterium]|nr:iron-sulfur cluster assembly scaffold protein [Elusimicrobiota bacterium]
MSERHVKDLLMEQFMNPRNVGEMADADGVGDVGNPMCGDIVRLFLKLKGDRIEKATFKTFGCRAAIATSSLLTEMIPGKTIDQALRIREEDILRVLGDLPPLKRHCGKLAELALQAAIGDHFARTRSDTALLKTVADRVRDPREWDPGLPVEDSAASPL